MFFPKISILLVLVLSANSISAENSNLFCADMTPQNNISIYQLTGVWYGIEKINHNEEKHYNRAYPSCPIITITEDNSRVSQPSSSLYSNFNYNSSMRYGSYGNNAQNYQRTTTYSYEPSRNINYIQREHQEFKHLKLVWDESGVSTTYYLRYNISRAGFWISSGPHNGSALEPQFGNFAGTIQVLKAIGNHLVLNLCHALPDQQLLTVILARENRLDSVEVYKAHNMLHRIGLNTHAVRKTCSFDGYSNGSSTTIFMGLNLMFLLFILSKLL